jgi:glycosyltransferase involved in cell wall biosynthesis
LPGYKSGGPLRTIQNMVRRLPQFEFFIFTRDRDALDKQPYSNIRVGQWNEVEAAKVFYSSNASMRALRRQIKAIRPDVLYLSSFFSPASIKTLFLRRLGLVPDLPAVLAPRGEFSPAALALKRFKKWVYLAVAFPRLYRGLIWQATSAFEKADIELRLGDGLDIHIASDLPPRIKPLSLSKPPKRSGAVKLVYLSRISPIKNLHYLLSRLRQVRGQVELDIWGPVSDPDYWNQCREEMALLPSSVRVSFRGPVEHELVTRTLAKYHFFVLPTLGENFGHVVPEAWAGGCPVVISDKTPWVNLGAKTVGWDVPLSDEAGWVAVLQRCVDMDQQTYTALSLACRQHVTEWAASPHLEQENISLFEKALQSTRGVVVPGARACSAGGPR